jgi:hypothetical protein
VILVRTAWHATQMTPRPHPPAESPVILEVALNGVTSRHRNPNVPATVEEHAKDALACVDAGATIIHTHAPQLVVGAEEATEQYATAFRPVVEQHPGIICYPTVGFGDTIEDRNRHVELLDDMGLVRQAAVDTGSVNLGGTGRDGLPPASEFVYTNTFAKIGYEMKMCTERGLGPSIAIFEPGFLQVVLAYSRAGALPPGTFVKFYFAAGGYLGGGDPLWVRRRSSKRSISSWRCSATRRWSGRSQCSAVRSSTPRSRAPRSNAAVTSASASKTGTRARPTSSRCRPRPRSAPK